MSGCAQVSREMAILAYFSLRICHTRRHDLCRTIARVIQDNSSGIEDTTFELPSHYNCLVRTNLCNTGTFTRISLIEEICLRCALRLLPVPSTFHPSRLDQWQSSSHVEHSDGRMIRGGQCCMCTLSLCRVCSLVAEAQLLKLEGHNVNCRQ